MLLCVLWSALLLASVSMDTSEAIHQGEVVPNAQPWMVNLLREENPAKPWELKPSCGGTLIHRRLVLTAKHCVKDKIKYVITMGFTGREEAFIEFTIRVTDIKPHPDDIDVAILHLSRDATELANVERPVGVVFPEIRPMPMARNFPVIGTRLSVYGWGMQENGRVSNQLQTTQVERVDLENCQRERGIAGGRPLANCDLNICGEGFKADYSGPCLGDSGGPLLFFREFGFELVGVISGGAGRDNQCDPGLRYSRYVGVPALCKWIGTTARALGINDVRGSKLCRPAPVCKCPAGGPRLLRRLLPDSPDLPQPCVLPPPTTTTTTTTTTTAAPPSDEGTHCFPAESIVTMETGITKRLDELVAGDRVQVMTSQYELGFSDVIMMLHAAPHAQLLYHVIWTSLATQPLRVSAEHLLLVQRRNQQPGFVFAGSAELGDHLFTVQEGHLVRATVTNITQEVLPGKFAPLTLEGTVVVDHVVASCYAYIPHHGLCHVAFAPARLLYQVAPWLLSNQPSKDSCAVDGVHWIVDLLQVPLAPALNTLGLNIPSNY